MAGEPDDHTRVRGEHFLERIPWTVAGVPTWIWLAAGSNLVIAAVTAYLWFQGTLQGKPVALAILGLGFLSNPPLTYFWFHRVLGAQFRDDE